MGERIEPRGRSATAGAAGPEATFYQPSHQAFLRQDSAAGTDARAVKEQSHMAHVRFAPCPHCDAPLSYLEGVSGSTMNPQCPRCHAAVSVVRATFLMADHSRPPERSSVGVKPQS